MANNQSEPKNNRKKPHDYDPSCEPVRPANLPAGAWWDEEDGIWRDSDGNPIGGG